MSNEISFKKEITGCFGFPVWDNPTEVMIEAAYQHHNMDFRYVTTEVKPENLEAAFEGIKALGYIGFNCTIPHKVAIIEHLDGLGESAQLIQAVNCIVKRGDQYIGENTDGKGFMESIKTVVEPKDKNVVVFGAGGAARAVCVELALAGANKIIIVNRTKERGEALLNIMKNGTEVECELTLLQESYSIPEQTDVIINCTSIGLSPMIEMVPVDVESLKPSMVVCDLIVNPPLTPFLKAAQTQGCKILDGVGMLVNQGRIGIKYWSGIEVESEVMRKAIEDIYA